MEQNSLSLYVIQIRNGPPVIYQMTWLFVLRGQLLNAAMDLIMFEYNVDEKL